ncbi:MAG TPA: histidine kinase [Burkholderiaceae bacterium]|jgi:two-component system sensor histidine kinase UhpB|nr:histidine kinase [Burkholderiaceae bacterium]
MSLRLKINLIVGVLTLLSVLALLAQHVEDDRQMVREQVEAANRVAMQLLNRMVWAYSAGGPDVLLSLLRSSGRVRSSDITLRAGDGHVVYQSPASTYLAGRDAPQWFQSLVSPPPIFQSMTLPDGHLELRSNASRAALEAWDEFVRLMLFSLALLVVGNAAVFWLVGRAVRPFETIVGALNALEGGRFDVTLPPLAGREAGAIGTAFNRMMGGLRQNMDNERRAAQAERQLSDSRQLARWIDGQLEQERRSIARELHDELGQSVTAMRSMALSIAQRVGAIDSQAANAARVIADESSRLYDAMHGLIPRLTPLVLDQLGLEEALRDLVERTRRSQPGVTIDLALEPGSAAASPEAALTLYRAAQEGLTNAIRHGHAQVLQLTLVRQDRTLLLEVLDDGGGLAQDWTQSDGHYGLRWLAERVEAVGGRFEIGARPEGGVQLVVQVPLEEVTEGTP